mmetsp:Transcript_98724/g.274721  ORF Transcript_98724/g.274721 Transcript_98724/m.274721 type:complete len:249 (-) Transcript_98724:1457-2203(-)
MRWPILRTLTVSQKMGSTAPTRPCCPPQPSPLTAAICARSASNSAQSTSKYWSMTPAPSSRLVSHSFSFSSLSDLPSSRMRLNFCTATLASSVSAASASSGNCHLVSRLLWGVATSATPRRPTSSDDSSAAGTAVQAAAAGSSSGSGRQREAGDAGPPCTLGRPAAAASGAPDPGSSGGGPGGSLRGLSRHRTVSCPSSTPVCMTFQLCLGGRSSSSAPSWCAQMRSLPTFGPNHQPRCSVPSRSSQK